MTTTPESYSQAKLGQQQMSEEGNRYFQQYQQALSTLKSAKQQMEAMEAKWASARQYIADQAAANLDNTGFQWLLEEDARIYADYQAALWRVTTVYTDAEAARLKQPV